MKNLLQNNWLGWGKEILLELGSRTLGFWADFAEAINQLFKGLTIYKI